MLDTHQDFVTRDLLGQPPIDPSEHSRLAGWLFDVIETEEATGLDRLSAGQLLEMIPDIGPATTVLRSRLEGTFGVPLTDISAGELTEEFGLVAGSSYLRVAGGNDRLSKSLANDLDVVLDTAVERIEQTGRSVRIGGADTTFDADFAIVAVPLPVLRSAGFLVGAPHSLRHSMSTIGMGMAAKLAIATEDEPPMFRRQEADIPGWYWTGADEAGGIRKAVTGFAGTPRGVDTLLAEAAERLRRAVPETAIVGKPLVADWSRDPWSRGCYSAFGPGQRRLLEELQRPWGRVVLAGEHVNGSGTMDGAVRSGQDAAALLLEMA